MSETITKKSRAKPALATGDATSVDPVKSLREKLMASPMVSGKGVERNAFGEVPVPGTKSFVAYKQLASDGYFGVFTRFNAGGSIRFLQFTKEELLENAAAFTKAAEAFDKATGLISKLGTGHAKKSVIITADQALFDALE